jgi:hypothetical protein
MKPTTIENWTWALIYIGAGVGIVGFWAMERNAALGQGLLLGGGLLTALGALGIWLRSRIDASPTDKEPPP